MKEIPQMGSVLRFSTFFALVGTLAAAIHFYLYRRLIRDTTQSRRVRQWGLAIVAGLFGMFIATRVLQRLISPNSQLLPLFSATWFWMGLATYLSFALWSLGLLRWLARSIGRLRDALAHRPSEAISPERRLFLSRAVAGGAVLAAGGLTTFGAWRAYAPALVSEIPVRLPRLSPKMDGFTIVQLSDLHLSNLIGRHFVDDVVRRANALKPDLVVITGDLVDGSVPQLGGTAAGLMNLQSRYGTFFVTGNHDYYSGDRAWCEALTRMGVHVLRNRFTTIGAEESGFDLVGVDDWGASGRYRKAGYDLDKALRGRDPDRPAVLLAHQPANFTVAAERGMGLQLSGHTHGGQFFPVTALVSLRYPRYAGRYTHGEGTLYVSRGTGFWGPPLRLGSPPEIVKITLVS
jgi:predicted MPP superfamily phosphohydrolase